MPGMVAFGRRWSIATDDFVVIGIVDSIFFFCWWCWSIVIYANFYQSLECNCPHGPWCLLLQLFFAGSCSLYFLNWILATSFIIVSVRGTVANPEPRQLVVTLVYTKCVLSLLDFTWTVLGTILVLQQYSCPNFNAELMVQIITGCLWFMFLVRLMMIWMFYDPRGRKKSPLRKYITNEYFTDSVPAGSAKKWRYRLQAFCFWFTSPSTDKTMAIRTISELLAFLAHDLDLVASDFIAALKLYRRECVEKYKSVDEQLKFTPSITLSDGTPADCFPVPDFPSWMNLKLAGRYASTGLGIFGWSWAIYRDYACALCAMWKYIRCCFCYRKERTIVEGDNCCGCNLAGLRVTSEYRFEDLVHVSFLNQVYQIPFFIAVDEDTASIVLTLRGSLSCADAITDVAAAFSPLDEESVPCSDGMLCHGGVLMAARRVKAKLESLKVLEKAFEGREAYHLVVTGHSLGAGVASVLTLLLRESYPDVRCFAFSPPPVLSEAALPQVKDNIFTLIFGNDIVPFLNYYNIRELLMRSVQLLHNCNLPKYKILTGCFGSAKNIPISGPATVISDNDENGSKLENDIVNDQRVNADQTKGGDIQLTYVPNKSKETKLCVPGRILHVRTSEFGYRLHIATPEDYRPLLFSPHMVLHHFPHFMENFLKQLGVEDTVRLKDS